jgi:hypothetical protein
LNTSNSVPKIEKEKTERHQKNKEILIKKCLTLQENKGILQDVWADISHKRECK